MPSARRRAERARGGTAAPNGRRGGPAWDDWQDDTTVHEPTALHALRLQAVHEALRTSGARSVADLGCGDGALVRRLLADPAIGRVVAIDRSLSALGRLERTVDAAQLSGGRLVLVQGSFTAAHRALAGVDAVVMVETIEHVAPALLSAVEQQVFAGLHADTVIVTTPNQEYNELFGMVPGQMREPEHHFEWSRQRFRAWAGGVAQRQGYVLAICGIGAADPQRGFPTQMATFTRVHRLQAGVRQQGSAEAGIDVPATGAAPQSQAAPPDAAAAELREVRATIKIGDSSPVPHPLTHGHIT